MGLWLKRVKNDLLENKQPLLIAIIVGAVAHFWMYAHGFVNPDALWQGKIYISNGWETISGRWGLLFFDWLHGGVNAPQIIALIIICFYSLTGVLLNCLFHVKGKFKKVLVPCLLVTNPIVSITITYCYCGDAYAISFFLAALAVFVAAGEMNPICSVLGGAVCFMISLSIYQSSLGVAAMLCIGVLVFYIKENHLDGIHKLILRLISMGLIGISAYYAILKLILHINGWEMTSYKGADKIGLFYILSNCWSGISNAYHDFWAYFVQDTIMVNGYGVRVCYTVAFGMFAIVMVRRFWSGRKNFAEILIIAGLLFISPVACNLIDLAAPDTRIILLTSGGMVIIVPLMIIMTNDELSVQTSRHRKLEIIRFLPICLSVCLIWAFSLIDNTDALLMERNEKAVDQLANRIYSQIESNEAYVSGCEAVIVGVPRMNENYAVITDELKENANSYATWALFWSGHQGAYNCWKQLFLQHLGIELRLCTEAKYREIAENPQFIGMPCYPQQGSVSIIENVLVVKMADMSMAPD